MVLLICSGCVCGVADSRIPGKKIPVQIQTRYFFWCCGVWWEDFWAAKLLFWITEWKEVAADPGFILRTMTDGFVVYGGIIGGIIAGWLYSRITKLNFLKYFDLMIPSVALAQGFGRIGCLLAGCCYGKETSGWPSITFHDSDFAPNGVALVPTQIYSSVLDFVHFAILLWIAPEQKGRRTGSCLLYDLLQRRAVYTGIFQRRSDQRKCGSSVHVSVYQYFYNGCRACYALVYNRKGRKKIGVQFILRTYRKVKLICSCNLHRIKGAGSLSKGTCIFCRKLLLDNKGKL